MEVKKQSMIQPTPPPDSITQETITGDMPVKGNSETNSTASANSAQSSLLAKDAKKSAKIEADLRRSVIEQDLDQPDMAAKAYQHNQTDLEFRKNKDSK